MNLHSDYDQSGVIPWRSIDEVIHVMVVTSRSKGDWILPKGYVEPQLTPDASAAKEAWEEAGVRGSVLNETVMVIEQEKWYNTLSLAYYPMRVTEIHEDYPEVNERDRRWVTEANYEEVIKRKKLKRVLAAFFELF